MSEEKLEAERDMLKRELRVAQEILFHVVDQHDGPVEIPGYKIKEGIGKDRLIDLQYLEDIDAWAVQVKEVPSE